jgi:hypothetical protein
MSACFVSQAASKWNWLRGIEALASTDERGMHLLVACKSCSGLRKRTER